MLRQEVYALDGTAREPHPYAVTEQNFTVRVLQRRGMNRHGVFLTHARESLTTHYERDPSDPRVGHALTLDVDDFGNVLRSVAIAYARRSPDPMLEARDQAKQAEILVTSVENRFTYAIDERDTHRTPAPCEGRTHELTGLTLPPGQMRFALDEILAAAAGAARIPYGDTPTPGALEQRLIEHVRTLYRRDDLDGPLPLGVQEPRALPFESYRLAFTPELVAGVYGGRVTGAMLAEGGYVHSNEDAAWWIPSGQVFYHPYPAATAAEELAFARGHFFQPHRTRDPFHTTAISTESFVTYDPFGLLIQETRDALGNRVTVGERDVDVSQPPVRLAHDYRVLQPSLVMDPNRNRAAVVFDALGLVVGTAVMGKPEESPVAGDHIDAGFRAELTAAEIAQFFADPKGPDAAALLAHATSRVVYDLDAFWRAAQADDAPPAVAASLARETHASAPVPQGGLRIQVSFSYSDGFGREIQKKVQAEPGPVPVRGHDGRVVVDADNQPIMSLPDFSPRWVGSGWAVFNNKGKPVRQYEPFFTDTHEFERDVRIGVSPVLFYDPLGRVVATLHPNRAWEKVTFGPWREERWDVNDTVLLDPQLDEAVSPMFSRLPTAEYLPTWHAQRAGGGLGSDEQDAAAKTVMHAGTPGIVHADSLGRAFLTVQHNRFERNGTIVDDRYATRVELDIEGNQRSVTDARDRVVVRHGYDMLGTAVHQASMEAGARWMLNDIAGRPLYAWDSRNHRFRTAYDPLRRPTESLLSTSGGPEQVVARTSYGEEYPQPETANLRGQAIAVRDQAGVARQTAFDFKGNLLHGERQLAVEYKATLDWSAAVPLETEIFRSATEYDALNRPVAMTTPDGSVQRPTFNDAGLLETIAVNLRGVPTETTFVRDIDYDAKGQRRRIDYGNDVTTEYRYDRLTYRLTQIETTRAADGAILQDLGYTYDPVGNITQIRDRAQPTIFFANQAVTPDNDYSYDAIYRLVTASGREHIGQLSQPETTWDDRGRVGLPHPGHGQAMRRYTESYEYDAVGNFERFVHVAANGNWTRVYGYEPSLLEPTKQNNRLRQTTVGAGTPETYTHDAHGNMTGMPHLTLMAWDFRDELHATARQAVTAGSPETTYYVYDGSGQRVRKVTERSNGVRKSERIYVGDFEKYREFDGGGALTLERETLHIAGEAQQIASVETCTHGNDGSPGQLQRYQFQNHLGSACMEVDDQGQVISYEEFAPFGSTTYQAARSALEAPKRYRFTGMERDEETGLSYHSKRYCIVWLGRWASSDPLGIRDGVNTYAYVRDQPTSLIDTTGTEGKRKLSEVLYCRADDPPPLARFDPNPVFVAPSNAPQMRSGGQSDFREVLPQDRFKGAPSVVEQFYANMANNRNINLLNVAQVLLLEVSGVDHRQYVETTAPLTNALVASGGMKATGNSAPQASPRPQLTTTLRSLESRAAPAAPSGGPSVAQSPPRPLAPIVGKAQVTKLGGQKHADTATTGAT
jgi:RHS repeat-associated protein